MSRFRILSAAVIAFAVGSCTNKGTAGVEAGSRTLGDGGVISVTIDSQVLRVPVPSGHATANELIPSMAGLMADSAAEMHAVFLPDSTLGAMRSGRPPAAIHMAAVAVMRGSMAMSVEQAQGYIAWERDNREANLRAFSTDSALHGRVQRLLRDDPEGRTDYPLSLVPGSRVGLATFQLVGRAHAVLQATTIPVETIEGPTALSNLRGQATVIVGDRVIVLLMIRNARATTRTVADLRHDFEVWMRRALAANGIALRTTPPPLHTRDDSAGPYPKFGEYVYLEELPEAISKIPPVYPEVARRASVSGTVVVQALLGRDGLVKETRVVESIPRLDEAAIEAVREWQFKPGMVGGKPIAVWVAIPVKFTLH